MNTQDLTEALNYGNNASLNYKVKKGNKDDDQIKTNVLKKTTDQDSKSDSKSALEEQEEPVRSSSSTKKTDLPYQCDKCNFKAKFKSTLKEHVISHSTERPYKCDRCPFAAKTMNVIKSHHLTHKDLSEVPRLFRCLKCEYVSKYKAVLKNHQLTHLDVSEIEETYPCDICNFVGKTKRSLECHKWVHKDCSQLETVECEFCDYETKHPKRIVWHKMKHHKNRNEFRLAKRFKCDKCDYMATLKSGLKKHQVMHTEDRPFKCDKCHFRAKCHTVMTKHQLIHMEEKKFQCAQCPYAARLEGYLRRHEIMHMRVRIFKCDKCDMTTKTKRCLEVHYLRIHKEPLPTTYQIIYSLNENIRDESYQMMQNSNDGSSVCEDDDDSSTLDIKYNYPNLLNTDIKVEDDLNSLNIKTEPDVAKKDYDNPNTESRLPHGINQQTILKADNNSNNCVVINKDKKRQQHRKERNRRYELKRKNLPLNVQEQNRQRYRKNSKAYRDRRKMVKNRSIDSSAIIQANISSSDKRRERNKRYYDKIKFKKMQQITHTLSMEEKEEKINHNKSASIIYSFGDKIQDESHQMIQVSNDESSTLDIKYNNYHNILDTYVKVEDGLLNNCIKTEPQEDKEYFNNRNTESFLSDGINRTTILKAENNSNNCFAPVFKKEYVEPLDTSDVTV